mmetsp:Transcript_69217/g.200855  ORF Transcript_69217/g.200855 Transcript_69217/m.200855 type:complete len:296 (-) Transcript_69217:286-1173(-)
MPVTFLGVDRHRHAQVDILVPCDHDLRRVERVRQRHRDAPRGRHGPLGALGDVGIDRRVLEEQPGAQTHVGVARDEVDLDRRAAAPHAVGCRHRSKKVGRPRGEHVRTISLADLPLRPVDAIRQLVSVGVDRQRALDGVGVELHDDTAPVDVEPRGLELWRGQRQRDDRVGVGEPSALHGRRLQRSKILGAQQPLLVDVLNVDGVVRTRGVLHDYEGSVREVVNCSGADLVDLVDEVRVAVGVDHVVHRGGTEGPVEENGHGADRRIAAVALAEPYVVERAVLGHVFAIFLEKRE